MRPALLLRRNQKSDNPMNITHSLYTLRSITQRRILPSTCSFSTSNNNTAATIVKGPSLLTQTGVFRPSPTLFFLPGLRSHPFWTAPSNHHGNKGVTVAYGDPTLTAITQLLENNYDIIREEYMQGVMGIGTKANNEPYPKPLASDYDIKASGGEHASTSLHVGTWDWHSYLSASIIQPRFETMFPKTTSILRLLRTPTYGSSLFDTSGNNPFAYCFFSTLQGKSHIKPHSGPMNLRLRIHFPLIVPKNLTHDASSSSSHKQSPKPKCGIRVGDQIRSWEEGKVLILDDSYEHEVWNETEDVRVLLLIDLWHPDVQREERERIAGMFQYARQQGWMR